MRTTLRQAREQVGVSMSELATRLGVAASSVSSLELNDERGAAKTETVDRALDALGLARLDVVLPKEELEQIEAEARRAATRAAWTMALEAQNISHRDFDALVITLILRGLAERE
jgi:transcriptional regulator with XRE-family HTH domain